MSKIEQLFAETRMAMTRCDRIERWREMQRAREASEDLTRDEIEALCGKDAALDINWEV